jgi:hypothetical protein
MLKRSLYILLLFTLSCIDPYKVEIPEGEQLLTVEGFITNEPGPHLIRLTRSDTYGSVFEGLIRPVTEAKVALRDSEGNVTFLSEEVERGSYFTPAGFQVQVGRSYILQIELLNGKTYSSLPEIANSVPQIDSLSYESVRTFTNDRLNDNVGTQIYAHFKDPSDQTNFYYWRSGPGDYVLVANPELYTLPPTHPTNPRGPAPKDCCEICFTKENSRIQSFAIAADEGFNGLSQKIPVAYIQDDGLRFKRTYRTEILQMAVSREAYRFLRLVQQQINITGSVFDQPPANIRGNIIGLTDPDEVVLGYFIVASVSRKPLYIENSRLSESATPRIIPDDCLTVPGATLDPPSYWNPPRD